MKKFNFFHVRYTLLAFTLLIFAGSACSHHSEPITSQKLDSQTPLFNLLTVGETGITFINNVVEDHRVNYVSCPYCYNGGGVAVGDINNDGLPDIYFTSNQERDRLFLNKGNLQFEDISETAGIGVTPDWSSGVTMADVNGDGLLDIYVCKSVIIYNKPAPNLLYINNGDLTFTESAEKYGIEDGGYSTQATFTDYDLDGDLDMFLINHAGVSKTLLAKEEAQKLGSSPRIRDKLYRNDGGSGFTNVTDEAGINTGYNYGLSVTAGDVNNDGYPDIYVANDYIGRDYLYINNGDGTFTDRLLEQMKHIPLYAMGADIADYNNDGLLDIFVLDMVSPDYYRSKVLMGAMSNEAFWWTVDNGFHYQFMANMLQLNNGNGTFSEVGQIAGVSQTDWSWGPLFADFDNDGFKDLLVTNGILRDVRHNDHDQRILDAIGGITTEDPELLKKNVDLILDAPSTKIPNYAFRNNGDYTFSDISEDWGLNKLGFSYGSAFADFDLDGDLDLVINNVNDTAFFYRNNSVQRDDVNFLRIKLKGSAHNAFGLGSKITLEMGDRMQYQDLTATRGFQSSSETIVHFGLGETRIVDKVEIVWPDGNAQTLQNVEANQVLTVDYANARAKQPQREEEQLLFAKVDPQNSGIDYEHKENPHDDFFVEILLPHKQSQNGPGIAVGDVNADGREDFYIGGALNSSGALFIQQADGRFNKTSDHPWRADRTSEDLGAVFFDADNDGDQDLYVVSGGNEYYLGSPELQDRLYLNDGAGGFTKSSGLLPEMRSSGSCATVGDYDGDGDLDVFVGGRVVPAKYPFPARSYLLRNDGGRFTDATKEVVPELFEPGLVTAALWTDFDDDGALDLAVVGEWMPIGFYRNADGVLSRIPDSLSGLQHTTGWWNSLVAGDFDSDGDTDYLAGNLGKNAKYKASPKKPLLVYCDDFDRNGTNDIVLAKYFDDNLLPVRGRECSSQQMPFVERKFPSYHDFAVSTLEDIYTKEALDNSLHYAAEMFTSSYIRNNGNGNFSVEPLPIEAQFGPVFGMTVHDFNGDGALDAALAGNYYASEVETIRYDAFVGLYLQGDGAGGFTPLPARKSGFSEDGDAKGMALLHNAASPKDVVLIGVNNVGLNAFETPRPAGTLVYPEALDRTALIELRDGGTRKHEFVYGSGYISQSSRALAIPAAAESVTIINSGGKRRNVPLQTVAIEVHR